MEFVLVRAGVDWWHLQGEIRFLKGAILAGGRKSSGDVIEVPPLVKAVV